MKKAMQAAMKATTISTGVSRFVFGPYSIAQSILFGPSFFVLGRGGSWDSWSCIVLSGKAMIRGMGGTLSSTYSHF